MVRGFSNFTLRYQTGFRCVQAQQMSAALGVMEDYINIQVARELTVTYPRLPQSTPSVQKVFWVFFWGESRVLAEIAE